MFFSVLKHPVVLSPLPLFFLTLFLTVDSQKDLVQPDETHLEGVPFFIQHPKPLYYTMKGHPATIECVAEPVSHAVIECAEQVIPYKGPEDSGRLKVTRLDSENRPDPEGKRWKLELQVRAKEVEEWFDSYACRCEAWNKVVELQRPKKVVSQEAIIVEAYLERKFQLEPVSTDLTVGKRLVLTCIAPKGKPDPEVYWLKDGKRVNRETFPQMLINDYDHLIVENVTMHDGGNYTCVAECLGLEYRYATAKVTILSPVGITTSPSEKFGKYADAWTEWRSCVWLVTPSTSPLCQQSRYRTCSPDWSNKSVFKEKSGEPITADSLPRAFKDYCPHPWIQTRNCSLAECTAATSAQELNTKFGASVSTEIGDFHHPLRTREIIVYVCIFLSLAIVLGIIAMIIAAKRGRHCTSGPFPLYNCCFQERNSFSTRKNGLLNKDPLLMNDFKQSNMTIKNLRAHDPSQFTNDGHFANGNLTTNEPQPMFVQYNEPINNMCPRYPTSMYGLSADLIGLRNPHQPSPVKSGAFIISSQSMVPVVCGEPTSQLTKPLVSMNNSCQPGVPVGMGNHPGSSLDAHYFLTNVNATSTNAAPLLITSSETNAQNNVIVQGAEVGSLSPKLTHTKNSQSPPKVSSGNDVQDENLKLPQTFSGSAVSSLFTDSSAGHSSVNTTTNTTAIGSRNADSSNGSPCLAINNYSQPTTNGMPQQEHTGLPNVTYDTHSRQSSSLYHYMSPDDVHKEELQDLDFLISATVTEKGGVLRLKESGVDLYIPPGAVRPNVQERVYLAVCRDDRQRPVLRDTQTLLSPVVQFGPANTRLLSHVIMTLPHCAELGDGCWFIRLLAMSSKAETEQLERLKFEKLMDNSALYATTNIMKIEEGDAIHVDINQEVNQWQEVFSVGFKAPGISWSESSEGVVCHLSPRTAHVIIQHPQRFCLVGESAGQVLVQRQKSVSMDPVAKHQVFNQSPAVKTLRLAAFSGRLTPTMDYNIRVYVLPDTLDAFQHVLHVERQSDGYLVDTTKPFHFQDNGAGLFFQIGELSFGWRSRLHAKTQEIPFRHIWSGTQMSTLHCAFSLEHVDLTQMSVSCQIVVFQGANRSHNETLHISSDAITASDQLLLKCTQHGLKSSCYRTASNWQSENFHGPLSSGIDGTNCMYRLPLNLKQQIILAVESTPKGWMDLAKQMGLECLISQLSSTDCPARKLLEIWESIYPGGQALNKLKFALQNVGWSEYANLLTLELMITWE
ncbi:hypothetical protein P879_03072 [Paragonimus westermani]|uniref:Netrin receptor UNC5 n=1 Tax=Paragonimus westermani TaxID=34504 RepID=A0A8T0DAZ8_9TREM|nr:hypothetical protein P879_03072 [Paragonimus westermani]